MPATDRQPEDEPVRTVLLEASAGTGKTFEIARRTTQALALGRVRVDQLLLVTFARAATEELGERVRTHLHDGVEALTDALAGRTPDPKQAELCAAEPEELRQRVERLRAALAAFDEATITTTHTFCSRMLRALGVLADFDPTWAVAESFTELVQELTDDTYLSRYRTLSRAPFGLTQAEQYAAAAAYSGPVETLARDPRIADFVQHVHAEFRRRKRRAGLLDYDDLQVLLRDSLADPVQGSAACRLLRDRFRLVLVDEFQDTDPVQWQILHTAFHGHVPLVLVGDPKQAIYGFRGGDIDTYLAARELVDARTGLTLNWRSDAPLVHGVDRILGGLALGDPQITVDSVQATHEESRIRGVPSAVRLRTLARGSLDDEPVGPQLHQVQAVRRRVLDDLVDRVLELLGPDVALRGDEGWAPVRPDQIAVLVGVNRRAVEVQEALQAAGVPAVLAVTDSVFASPAAADWAQLLDALARPTDQARLRACALTAFFGWSGDRLAVAEDVDEVGEQLARWNEILDARGVGGLLDDACTRTDLTARVLREADGERRLTDLRHLGELLQEREREGVTSAAGLAGWLRAHRESAGDGQRPATDGSRRLESDAVAVKVMTIHAAKGLEFPIVLLPFAADHTPWVDDKGPLRIQRGISRRIVTDRDDAELTQWRQVQAGEHLRLLYVAMTRPASHLLVWWTANTNAPRSALHRVLFGERAAEQGPAESVPVPDDDEARTVLDAVAAGSDGTIRHEPLPPTGPPPTPRPAPGAGPADPAELVARRFGRTLDLRWRRTSYTALTAEVHDLPSAPGASEPESVGIQDEPDEDTEQPTPTTPTAGGPPSPMAELPGGTGFGTLVHTILEDFQPGDPDPAGRLAELTRDAARVSGLTAEQTDLLAAGLATVVQTPLGPLAPGHTLATLPDRLAELDFELPLAGGDHPSDSRTVGELADLMQRELPADDPLAGYPAHLRVPDLAAKALRGYLTGSVDAVLRVHDEQHPRFLVVDYKTNRLAGPEEALRLEHYLPGPMTEAMIRAHYPLQALLYQVALHRYLRWRQPGYTPERHLGGVLYLFVRGMGGPDAPPGTGVFSWRPPATLVVQASRLLAGQR